MTKTINELKNDLFEGAYDSKPVKHPVYLKSGHVFDEDKSVKWNREKVEDYNKNLEKEYHAAIAANDTYALKEKLKNDIVDTLSDDYNVSKGAVEVAYYYAMNEVPNMFELIDKIEEVLDLYDDMIAASKRP